MVSVLFEKRFGNRLRQNGDGNPPPSPKQIDTKRTVSEQTGKKKTERQYKF
jgi:hypothetical protein